MRRRILLLIAAATSGCAATPTHPIIAARVERVAIPVSQTCVNSSQIPAMPESIGDRLTGRAASDADLLAAADLRLRATLRQALALLDGCSGG